MATLLSKKLICPADCAPHASYLPPTLADRTSLLPVPPAAMGWRGFLIILRMIKTMIEVRHRPILDLVRGLQARKAQIPLAQTVPQDGLSYASSVAAALRGADLLLGANHHCLPRSICAMRLMLEHGLTPSMVMGVTEKPFEAHCWIELGPFVVADAPDRIMPYTPIFVL
ncbi:MAG: lasso peptide biosynthesis B2 protein [Sphingomonadales bacterium]|nr:lasso peptide biosynthesis B2 protein [Sphingomonadales bacterium]MDE2169400.1 lasso peptide biosynthesis B2 protein [Sphingomonadales bacterium]